MVDGERWLIDRQWSRPNGHAVYDLGYGIGERAWTVLLEHRLARKTGRIPFHPPLVTAPQSDREVTNA